MNDAAAGHVPLQGPLTIRQIGEVHENLTAALAANQSVILDIAADAEVDISFVQLVLAARVSAHASGKQIALKAASTGRLLDVLERGGFLAADETGFWTRGDLPQ